jgi:3-isopropylmalate/(R)-2-methylmalate dehydratase small subunit
VGGRPETIVTIDLLAQIVRTDDGFQSPLAIPEGSRQALLAGRWDPIGELLEGRDRVRALAASIPYARLG